MVPCSENPCPRVPPPPSQRLSGHTRKELFNAASFRCPPTPSNPVYKPVNLVTLIKWGPWTKCNIFEYGWREKCILNFTKCLCHCHQWKSPTFSYPITLWQISENISYTHHLFTSALGSQSATGVHHLKHQQRYHLSMDSSCPPKFLCCGSNL